ncbi:Protein CBG10429 [Caenorhabditis briggsae]|uniref:Protein CBG10429 n=1 Tax=Caenorhabditis briggsae TaxID=6238 RepID=A8XB70_CAEBR|nr:Protein CBG10429 [Caenorhabditis briggsae]CAP29850.2 Protein CBG10429 [Caenorhabditis briggsae]
MLVIFTVLVSLLFPMGDAVISGDLNCTVYNGTFHFSVPRVSCSTVSRSMCLSVAWRQILAEDCPNICGFCDLNGCIDAVVGCDNDMSICNAIGMQEFVNQNCRRTCGRCSVTTPKPCQSG